MVPWSIDVFNRMMMIMCVANLINQFPSILSLAPTLHPPQASGWSQHHHHSHRKEPRDHHCRSPPGCSIIYHLRSLLHTLGLLSSSTVATALVNVVSEVGLVLEILDREVEEVELCWCFSNSTIGVVGVLLLST